MTTRFANGVYFLKLLVLSSDVIRAKANPLWHVPSAFAFPFLMSFFLTTPLPFFERGLSVFSCHDGGLSSRGACYFPSLCAF